MGQIIELFGFKHPILSSQVTFLADRSVNVTFKDYNKSVENTEYIGLLLFHYAKMLMIIPKNYGGVIPFLQTMNQVTLSDNLRKSLILEFGDLEFKLLCGDPLKMKHQDRRFITNLFKPSDDIRYITTRIPSIGPTSQALLSVKELIEFLISKLSLTEIAIMKDALWNMTNEYINGVNFHSLKQSRIIPATCMLNAIKKNKI
jgi:hypothetical protein